MNHRTQNHSGALEAGPESCQNLCQTGNAVVQMPVGYVIDATVGIQMATTNTGIPTGTKLPAGERSDHNYYSSDSELAHRRVEIQRDDRLRLTLQEWKDSLKSSVLAVQFGRAYCINVKNELYQLIGFYTVFQGVVLTAVAQASLLQCHTSWGPGVLSLLASVVTIPAVHDRLKDYNVHKTKLFWLLEASNVINEKIKVLKRKGACFDFAEDAGVQEKIHAEGKKRQFRAQSRKNQAAKWFTTLFLCVFSSVILACCYVIPCWKNH